MKMSGELVLLLNEFLSSALGGGGWSPSQPACLTPPPKESYLLDRRPAPCNQFGHGGKEQRLFLRRLSKVVP